MEDEPTAPISPATPKGAEPTAPPGVWVPPPAPAQPPPSSPQPGAGRPSRATQILGRRATGWFVAALLVGAVVGLSVALTNAPGASRAIVGFQGPVTVRPPATFQVPAPASGATPFRVGGFIAGKVTSVSASSFTVSTASGSALTVDEQSSTIYRSAGASVTKASVKKGDTVLVVGATSGSTVKADEVLIGSLGRRLFYLP